MNTEARWGIANPSGGWEEHLIAEANPPKPNLDDNAQKRAVLLVDRHGRPLIVREPRPVGFRR